MQTHALLPLQVEGAVQEPQLTVPPHPFGIEPQTWPVPHVVIGVQPQTFGMPPPPQVSVPVQPGPQVMAPPQTVPQFCPAAQPQIVVHCVPVALHCVPGAQVPHVT